MSVKRYFIRFIKSCVFLTLWLVILLGIMLAFHQTNMQFSDLFTTSDGRSFWLMVLAFSLLYPLFGYAKRKLTVDATTIPEEINRIAVRGRFKKVNDDPYHMIFRTDSITKALWLQYEDKITIDTVDGVSTIEGPRKEIVKIMFRIDTYMISQNKN